MDFEEKGNSAMDLTSSLYMNMAKRKTEKTTMKTERLPPFRPLDPPCFIENVSEESKEDFRRKRCMERLNCEEKMRIVWR